MASRVVAAVAASLPVIGALLDQARKKNYAHGGVLGIRAKPEWNGPAEFEHAGLPVRVVPCESALAVREALISQKLDHWLVILTDRDEEDLGIGITAHLVYQRLRHPDPWEAVRDRFAATQVEHRLVDLAREVATGLLIATPTGRDWPPARGGVLTLDHALASVATCRLEIGAIGAAVDSETVLRWSVRADAGARLADLRALAGDALVDALLRWLADCCGALGVPVKSLLVAGRALDIVPLGLAARVVVASAPESGPRALLRRELAAHPTDAVLAAWANDSETVAHSLLGSDDHTAARVLARADALLSALEALAIAAESDVLRSGLTARLAELGEALRRCTDRAATRADASGPDAPLADLTVLPTVEHARERVEAHILATHRDELRVHRALAGVRLARWLARATNVGPTSDFPAHLALHRDVDAWADRAIADAWSGVSDEALARGLKAVLGAARIRRDAHDRSFASALATRQAAAPESDQGLLNIEDLLQTVVVPLAKARPTLLIVADGMSAAVATEVLDDLVRRYESWLEYLPAGRQRRLAALAALPSLTSISRASLLTGELSVGEQGVEQIGFARFTKATGVTARLFHKLALDTSEAGFVLARDVVEAVEDTGSSQLVACVLNTIDDALDRSDPGGTEWSADAVKHLRPLLDLARRAGRLVVLTSDHGHVVERRDGRMVSVTSASSNRSRPYAGGPLPGDGEVRVTGSRVLLHDGDAVLAVDERLRYGPLKAGYHGGAAPAEVVVPVHVLAPGEELDGWELAPPQSPDWWRAPVGGAEPSQSMPEQVGPAPTLFDQTTATHDLATAVLISSTYRDQRSRSARVALSDDQVGRLLRALLAARANRLDPESAAAAVGVATLHLSGALSMAQRLLNVEQYPVLSRDPDGATVVLDATLLREQFEVDG